MHTQGAKRFLFFLFLISIVSFPHARTVAGFGFASSSWGTGHGRLAAREKKAHPAGDGGGWPAGPRRSCPGLDEGATRAVPWPGAGRTLRRATTSPTGDVCWPSGAMLCDVAKWRGREGRAEEKDEGGAHLVKDQRGEDGREVTADDKASCSDEASADVGASSA